MSRAKRHHYTPQAYLSRFANEDGFLRVYDRITHETRSLRTKDVAVVSNLYTVEDEQGNPSDAFEQRVLAEIDGDIATVLPKLLEPVPALTDRDREVVNVFLALQFGRAPWSRKFLSDSYDLHLRLSVEMNVAGAPPEKVERFIEERFPSSSEREKARMRQIAADPSQPVELTTEEWIDAIMHSLSSLAKMLDTRQWSFVGPEGGAFLTCDLPVVLAGPQPVGIGNAVFIFWPLSPDRVLLLGPPDSHDGESFGGGSAPADLVRDFNQMTADQALRQVCWRPDTDLVSDIRLPEGPLVGSINGIAVGPDERSYDKIRDDWLRIRDDLRARRFNDPRLQRRKLPE